MKNRNIAIIPARSGSKGLIDKNIKLLNKKPLLAYSIEAAKRSNQFQIIHVSTDSEKYAEISGRYGADVPFLREKELSSDASSTWDGIRYVLREYRKLGMEFDTVCVLQPTSPLRTEEDIVQGYQMKEDKKALAVVGVCETDHSPLWSNTLPENFSMGQFIRKEIASLPRQQLDRYYRINGALYIVDTDIIENEKDIYTEQCYGYLMPRERSIDIDDRLDFIMAEAVVKEEKQK